MKVAVLGASPKQHRYSNMAVRKLKEHGITVIPVNPMHQEIEGLKVRRSLEDLSPGEVDTVTVYLGPSRSSLLSEQLLAVKPRRVIFNPGAENLALENILRENGVEVEEGCTLVMLAAGTF